MTPPLQSVEDILLEFQRSQGVIHLTDTDGSEFTLNKRACTLYIKRPPTSVGNAPNSTISPPRIIMESLSGVNSMDVHTDTAVNRIKLTLDASRRTPDSSFGFVIPITPFWENAIYQVAVPYIQQVIDHNSSMVGSSLPTHVGRYAADGDRDKDVATILQSVSATLGTLLHEIEVNEKVKEFWQQFDPDKAPELPGSYIGPYGVLKGNVATSDKDTVTTYKERMAPAYSECIRNGVDDSSAAPDSGDGKKEY